MPAKGATHIIPRECCDRVKQRERMRSEDWPLVTGQTRTPGWGWIRAVKMAEGRRAGPLDAAAPPALRPWFARGRGEPRR